MRIALLVFLASSLAPGFAKAQFHDDFTGKKIASQWTWSDPGNDAKYALLPRKGQLRQTVPPGNDHTTGHGAPLYAGPMLTVPISGDFTITTHVNVNYPRAPSAMESGLMIWKSKSNNLQFKRTNGFNTQNVLYYGNIANARTTFHGNKGISANSVYLRIQRVGNKFTSYFGTDGKTWKVGGAVTWKVTGTLNVGIATSYWLWFGISKTPTTGDYTFFDLAVPSKTQLASDRAGFSAASGGTIAMDLAMGAANKGQIYLILGSLSGSFPGIPLPGGAKLPINFDTMTSLSLTFAGNPGIFPSSVGLLSATGTAKASAIMPAVHLKPFTGKSLRFAAVVFPKGGSGAWAATNAAIHGILP
jgi:regulation of enolase protein 1 (concanavalin A-like superfamily)